MKKIITITFLLVSLNKTVLAQMPNTLKLFPLESTSADSSLLDYFPLNEGNLWQYRFRNNPGQMGWVENMISYGDTVMTDGLTYTQLLNPPYYGTGYIKYCRIDSLYNVLEYIDSLCTLNDEPDTSGLFVPPNSFGCLVDTSISIFKLNVSDSTYWSTFFNIGDNLFLPSLRYMGEYETEIFGMQTNAKVFSQYFRQYFPGPGIWEEYYGWNYVLVKGIGIYSTGFGESSTATLEGAIINGIKYGTVVGITDEHINNPKSFVLYQNYPNPFNNQTTITFSLENSQRIKLAVYDILGKRISTLEDGFLDSGMHVRTFSADNISTGVFFVRLNSENQIAVKKIIHLK